MIGGTSKNWRIVGSIGCFEEKISREANKETAPLYVIDTVLVRQS